MAEKFKTALFGYSKQEVCKYISNICDGLISKHNQEKQALNDRIRTLEEENVKLTKEKLAMESKLAQMSDDNTKVSEIIIDARHFADGLKARATEQNLREIEENSRRNAEVEGLIKKNMNDVVEIQLFLRKFLEYADCGLQQISDKLEAIETVETVAHKE